MKKQKEIKKRVNITLDYNILKKSKKILKKNKSNLSKFTNQNLINLVNE